MRGWQYVRWFVVIIVASLGGMILAHLTNGDSMDARLFTVFGILGYLDSRIDRKEDRR